MSEAPGQPLSFTVGPQEAGLRLDVFLAGRCPDLSRSRIRTDLDRPDTATVDGRERPASFRLRVGQRVVFCTQAPVPLSAVPQPIDLDVVYEDAYLVVVNKPVGLVVHPAAGHPDGTLVNALLHRQGPINAGGDPLRPGIVHRLDRDTSGLLVAALDERSHRRLAAQLQDRRMGRAYLALSWGRWTEPEGALDGPIGRDPHRRQRMAVVAAGRPALTRYRVIEDFGFAQYSRVELSTGRTHQIRVHFGHAGHPVIGDPLYGEPGRARGLHGPDRRLAELAAKLATRQMLHACELRFLHPADGREMSFRAPPPADFAAVLARLRGAAGAPPGAG
ncbi:MAG: RluA family pseudouridine synthase [bacterium]|nr:RluA family pseudouridine synthase [bacterium]